VTWEAAGVLAAASRSAAGVHVALVAGARTVLTRITDLREHDDGRSHWFQEHRDRIARSAAPTRAASTIA